LDTRAKAKLNDRSRGSVVANPNEQRSAGTPPSVPVAEVSSGSDFRLGFWAALLTAAVTALFAVAAIATPARSGPFCRSDCVPSPYIDVARFIPGDYLWLIPGTLLAPIFIVLMASIHSYAPERRRTFSQIALSFAVIYGVVIVVNYFVQLAVVVPSLQSGETQGLSLFTQYNPHGLFIALEVLAYLMMSAAFLSAAPVFSGSKIDGTIRWLFALGFTGAISAFVGFWLLNHDLVAVEVVVLMINWLVLIIGSVSLSVVFRRAHRRVGSGGRGPSIAAPY
jgi:hypothetical protein